MPSMPRKFGSDAATAPSPISVEVQGNFSMATNSRSGKCAPPNTAPPPV